MENKIQPQQLGLVSDLMKAIDNDDVELFLETLCREDRSYIYGAFKALQSNGYEELTLENWEKESFRKIKEKFKDNKGDYGVVPQVRYHDKLTGDIFLQKASKDGSPNIEETEIKYITLPVILQTSLTEDDEIVGEWKLSLFVSEA
ncbi:hypothetical protein [Bacillus dakarensis]|uniref:hypothetical protein n=1 Tax=Robertmurraya dakarensis TaxID=1926278 RepID=UPI0009811E93|nr:hypothetical protein [Bacillus dakarensis]